jgi:phage shock protein A
MVEGGLDQVRSLEQTTTTLKGQVDTLATKTRELRDNLVAAEPKAAATRRSRRGKGMR